MKNILSTSFLLLLSSLLSAQPQTFTIEKKLKKAQYGLTTVEPHLLYNKVEQNLVKISITDDLVYEGTHPVLGGFLKAYKQHRPVTISPDIMWLLICQGFGQHVNNNAEKLRKKFVDFEGQKELVVIRDVNSGTNLETFPWESVFPEFVEKIGTYTGTELTEVLSCDFTTTTQASLISSQITIMESMKKYFKYKVVMIGCGIPEVTIEGTVDDWKKILNKLDYLAKYDLEWWVKELKPVIQEIINTKSGKFKKEFWMDMVRYHREGLYGSYTEIDGWLLKFYPYDRNGKKNDMKTLSSIGKLPDEIVRVPFVFDMNIDKETTVKSCNMEFWAGFMGLKQDEETLSLKPEIGWAINFLSDSLSDNTDIIHIVPLGQN